MADFEEEDNPFADAGDADDYNPFDDSMFDKKPTPAAAPAAPAEKGSKKAAIPAWAEAEEKTDFVKEAAAAPASKKVKEKTVFAEPVQSPPPATYTPTMSPVSPDPNVPDWAHEPAQKGNYSNSAGVKEPLLGGSKNTGGSAGTGSSTDHQFVGGGGDGSGGGGICMSGAPYDAGRAANWPPFPARCPYPFKPCFYQYFGEPEIPVIWRTSLRGMFTLWCVYVFALFWNLIARLAALDCKNCDSTVTGMFLALGFFLIFGPCAYYWWFRTLYNAARSDSTLKYGCFFCTFTMQMGACIFFAIGPPGTGSSGIWTASIATQENKEVSFLMWAAAVLWVLLSIANIVGVQKVLITFRTSGMAENAVERAQKEAAAGAGQVAFQAAQTPAGRDIAVSAAMGAYGSNA